MRLRPLTIALLLALPAIASMTVTRRSAQLPVKNGLVVKLTQQGLDYLAMLLEKGLEAQNLKGDIVDALEGQAFDILIPQFGGYAHIVVDYGPGRPASYLDGFRYDNIGIELSSIPLAPRVVPESGVIYPALHLENYQGDQLPQLHVFISYPPFIPASTPISAIAEAILVTSGVLRPTFDDGRFRVLAENFETQVTDMDIIAWQNFPPGLTAQEQALKDALGAAVLDGMAKEVNDALSGVFMSGLNDILFDRDKDGEADLLLDISDMFKDINSQFDTSFAYNFSSRFQSNPVTPAEALLKIDTTVFTTSTGNCVGSDVFDKARYTLLENDGNKDHDPPTLPLNLPSGKPYQYALSLSDDLLNNILLAVYKSGKLCLTIGADSESLPPEITDLMNVDTFAALGGQWLADAAPGAPLRFSLQPIAAPYIVIPDSDTTFELHLPEFFLNVYVEISGSWFRAVGYHGAMTANVTLNKFSLGSTPMLDLTLDIQSYTDPIFGEMIPDADPEEVSALFPMLFQVAGGQLEERAGQFDFALLNCIQGVTVDDFVLRKDGVANGLANYLQLFINLSGVVDLGYLLGQCLLGEPLVPSHTPNTVLLLTPTDSWTPKNFVPVRYSLNGAPASYWRPDGLPVSHLRGGSNQLVVENQAGESRNFTLQFDRSPPSIRRQNNKILFGETVLPERGSWIFRDKNGELISKGTDLRSSPAVPAGAYSITARNAAGLQNTRILTAQQNDIGGCSSTGNVPLWPLLILFAGLFFRRPSAQSF